MYPHVDLRLVFTNKFTIGSLFTHKDRMPTSLCSDIVYSYNCGDCMSQYIGSSIRQFRCRISEHRGVSVRTGRPLTSINNSAIKEHSLTHNHIIKQDNFKIIGKTNQYNIRTLEAILITTKKPNLNTGLPCELSILTI